MTLVRVWRGQLLGGVGASALVPVTLLASLAVLGLAGGFGGLSALGQAFSGPSVPGSAPHGAHPGANARPVSATLVAALSAGTPARAGTSAGGSTPPSGVSTAGLQPPAPGGSPTTGNRGPSARQQPAGGPTAARRPEAHPQPQPQPTVADGVVAVGTSVTSQVPG